MLHSALHEVTGAVPVFRKRPRDALALRHGGAYRTESGAARGPTPYLYVAALVAKWEAFPQTTLMAAAVRLGYLSKEEAAALVGGNIEAVTAGLEDLQERQEALKKFEVRLHPEQNFSSTPSAPGTVPPIPQTEAAVMKKHAAEVSRFDDTTV